jgi:hypothetical protein
MDPMSMAGGDVMIYAVQHCTVAMHIAHRSGGKRKSPVHACSSLGSLPATIMSRNGLASKHFTCSLMLDHCVTITVLHDKHIVGNCDLLPVGMATPPHE